MSIEREKESKGKKIILIKTRGDEIPQTMYYDQADSKIKKIILDEKTRLEKQSIEWDWDEFISQKKSHNQRRSSKEFKDVIKSANEKERRLAEKIKRLSKYNASPLLVELNGDNMAVSCTSAIGHEDMQWLRFVSDNPNLMEKNEETVNLVQKAFRYRLRSFNGETGAHQQYLELVKTELRDKPELDKYLIEITQKYGKK